MLFRTAEPADVDDLVVLVNDAYRREGGWTTEAHLLAGQRTDAAAVSELLDTLVLAHEAGQVLGCCSLTVVDDHGYFGTFAVRQDTQGKGVGAALLAEAERRAAEAGLAYVEMTVLAGRTELIAFYVRRGYTPTGATAPFPYGDERFGQPLTEDLEFVVLQKPLR
jgi:ribosomal protein S18 acetylase RimI-like enzyme